MKHNKTNLYMKKIILSTLLIVSSAILIVSCKQSGNRTDKSNNNNPITHADVERWLSAWNSHNIDTIDALFSEDALIYQPQNPKPLTKKTMNPFFEMVFKTYPDIKFNKVGITVEGYDAASWEDVTGTMLGPFTDPSTGKTLQPTRKRFDHQGAMHITYNPDHTIKEVHIIWDQLIVLKQLGLSCD
jgi:steroid delta-isomerase-like uncharacterized protein